MDQFLVEAQAFAAANNYPKPVFLAFRSQYLFAQKRGVAWEFSIQEWWDWWQTDNRWANRGAGRDKFVMARFKDLGPYHPANTYCATGSQNGADARGNPKRKAAASAWWDKRRAVGAAFGSRSASLGNPGRITISLPDPQISWLRREAKRLGVTIGELVRRLLDQVRDAQPAREPRQ